MNKTLRCLFFLIYSSLWSSTAELEAFFKATKNQNFEVAVTIASNMEDAAVKDYLNVLVELMVKKSVNPNIISNKEQTEDENLNFIKYLVAAYQYNYAEKQNNLEAYKLFSSALKLASKLDQNEFKKAALIGILDLFANEIFIGSKQFDAYLEQFSELREDSADEAILLLYKLVFLSKAGENIDAIDTQYYIYYKKLDSIFNYFPANHSFYLRYYLEKGIYHKIEKNYDKAENFFLRADSIASKNNYLDDYRARIAWQIAHLKLQKGQPQDSKYYLNIARHFSSRLKHRFYHDRMASALFQKERKYDSAYHYLRKSVDIEYQLGYKNNTLETAILTVQNQTDKLKLDKLELESSNTRNKNWAVLLGLLLVLGTAIGVLVNKNTKRKQLLAEQEKTLEQQKVSNMLKEQELVAIDAMIEGQEKERQRVANELHDDLGSLMAAVKLQFNSLEVKEKKDNLETFSKTDELIDEAYGKIRAIAHAKNSGLMAKQGLLQAVNQMAEKISIVNGLQVSVLDHGLETRLENSMELTLFRIIQELLTNVIKHAEATEVNIHITNHGDTLNILVEDNGKGFVTQQITNSEKGMGLKSIDKRVAHLHGSMDIESELTKGTVVIIDIPI